MPSRKPSIRSALSLSPPPITILDIGAMPEGADRYAPLLDQQLATVIGFEPNPAQLAQLLAQRHPHKRFLPYFLGNGGPATFHITHYPGCCSLYEPDPAVINLFMTMGTLHDQDNYRVLKTLPVQTTRLDDIPDLPPADFLKLDVQGSELAILQNATRTLQSALVLEVEAEFLPLYKNQPLFGDLHVFLRDRGFLLHKFIDIGGRALRPLQFGDNPCEPLSQLLFADAIFVRDFINLSSWSDPDLLKAAAILYEIYNSHDLVYRLLVEHDRRHAIATAAHFIQTLRTLSPIPTTYLTQKLHT